MKNPEVVHAPAHRAAELVRELPDGAAGERESSRSPYESN